jgi:hypothetical protein
MRRYFFLPFKPWKEVILEKLIVFQLLNKSPNIYGTR